MYLILIDGYCRQRIKIQSDSQSVATVALPIHYPDTNYIAIKYISANSGTNLVGVMYWTDRRTDSVRVVNNSAYISFSDGFVVTIGYI